MLTNIFNFKFIDSSDIQKIRKQVNAEAERESEKKLKKMEDQSE